MVWTALTTIAVPANATTEWFAGSVSGRLRARIRTPVTGGTVTVTAVWPEEQKAGAAAPVHEFGELRSAVSVEQSDK